jgi:hypothetical protein
LFKKRKNINFEITMAARTAVKNAPFIRTEIRAKYLKGDVVDIGLENCPCYQTITDQSTSTALDYTLGVHVINYGAPVTISPDPSGTGLSDGDTHVVVNVDPVNNVTLQPVGNPWSITLQPYYFARTMYIAGVWVREY